MNKILLLCACTLIAMIACAQSTCAPLCNPHNVCTPCTSQPNNNYGVTFIFKNGYFYPQDCVMRNIFDRCGSKGTYWIEGAARFPLLNNLKIEASGSYTHKKGMALNGNECIDFKMPTCAIAITYLFQFKKSIDLKYKFYRANYCNSWDYFFERLSFFVGGGLRLFFYSERNGSAYVAQRVDKTTVGGMVNAGLEIDLWKGLFLDLFVDYNFGKVDLDRNDLCNTCNPCCTPCAPTTTVPCTTCCPSCCFDLNVGGVIGGIGIGYRF